MNITIFYTIFVFLGLTYLVLGLLAARKIQTVDDYFLAGRKLGFFAVVMTLLATQIGGGMVLGTADYAYNLGYYGMAYTVGMVLGFTIMAAGLASRLRALHVSTTAEIFVVKYHSEFLRKLAALLMVIALGGILVAQVIAARRFMIALDVYNDWLFIGFWLFVVVYTMMGGLKAVVWTDIVQVAIVVLIFIGIFVVTTLSFPLTSLEWKPSPTALEQANLSWIIILFGPVLFNIIEQDLAQRYCAASSKRVAALAAAAAAIFLLVFAIVPTYFGILAQQLAIDVPEGAAVLMVVLNTISNDFVLILIATALLAAIVSTADSLLCAVSSNLSQDFGWWQKDSTRAVQWSRLVTLLCGVIALIIAYRFDNIIEVIVYSYLAPVSAITVPIFFALILKRVRTQAAIVAVFVGLLGVFDFFVTQQINLYEANELMPVTLSLIGYLVTWGWLSYRA